MTLLYNNKFLIIIGGQYEQLHQRVNRTVLKSQNLERKGLGIAKLSLLKKKATETYAPLAKGQLISKCPFSVIVWTKIPTNYLKISTLVSKKWLNQKRKNTLFFFKF